MKSLYKRKILNYRPVVAIALSLAVGIYFASKEIDARVTVALALFLTVFLCLGIFSKNVERKGVFLNICMIVLAIIVGFLVGKIQLDFFVKDIVTGYGEIVGSVTNVTHGNGKSKAILDNLKFNGQAIGGKAEISVGINSSFEVGNIIKGIGNLKGSNAISAEKIYSNYVSENIKYIGSLEHISIVGNYKLSLSQNIRMNVFEALKNNLEFQNAGIVMGMTFGDTSMMNYNVTRAFQVSGLGHLFAVSGLHVGFFYVACKRILKKLPLHIRSAIAFVMVGLYVYTCGMTTSATRAFVMITVMILCENLLFEVDGLTNLAFAMAIVLLTNPYSLFSAGFALSFGATLGLIILKPPIARLLPLSDVKKDTVGGLIAIQIMTLPLMSFYFSYISTFSFVLNLVLIPIISIMYILNMAIILLQQIVGINLLFLTNLMVGLLKNILIAIESTNIAVIDYKFSPLSLIITAVGAFIASDLVMINSATKLKITITLSVMLVVSLFL